MAFTSWSRPGCFARCGARHVAGGGRFEHRVPLPGSSRTGAAIMEAAALSLKRVGLELGGKAPAVVCADADLDLAVKELCHGSLATAGQICVAAARFLVHESVVDDFKGRMVGAYRKVRGAGE